MPLDAYPVGSPEHALAAELVDRVLRGEGSSHAN